ncbi:MAG: flagellar biosynthetic protein FliR [Pirellulales bacterium]|nr:flagellar biosynthetic protein FliR [Pirellulales bacterium]
MPFPVHPDQVAMLALVVARVAPLVIVAPIFGSRNVPLHLRLLLAVVLGLLVSPLWLNTSAGAFQGAPALVLALAAEAVIGLSLGLAVLIIFHGAELAGRLIGQTGGLVLSDGAGGELPGGAAVPAQLLYLVALAIFVAMGGHRQVVGALLESFQSMPPGSSLMPIRVTAATTNLLAGSFQLAIRTAAPVIIALLMANLAIGVLSRGVPQLNSLFVGFGLNVFIILAALLFSISAMTYLFGNHVESQLQLWQQQL